LIGLAAGGLVLWFVTSFTIAMVFADNAPAVSLRVWPHHAGAKAQMAVNLVGDGRDLQRRAGDIASWARRAIEREPSNVKAIRAFGLASAAQLRQSQASAIFRYSESLSRRDVPTQLWLIEEAVAANDIRRALQHYNRAMLTSLPARTQLNPILAQAAADPAILTPLVRMLEGRPLYWQDTAYAIVASCPATRLCVPAIFSRMQLNHRSGTERNIMLVGLSRLVGEGAYQQAWSLYERLPGAQTDGYLRGGGFDRAGGYPPFDWVLSEDPDLIAHMQDGSSDGASGQALFVAANGGKSGEVARQLLLLPPGAYTLAARVGLVPQDEADRPLIEVVCAGAERSSIVRRIFPSASEQPASLVLNFQVPSGCAAQWLVVSVRGSLSGQSSESWIDQMALRKLN